MAPLAGVLGLGLVAFWTWGLLFGGVSRAAEPWPGFRDHELPFAPADLVLGAALIAGATIAPWLLPLCGGALIFLGLLDAAYLARTWNRRSAAMKARTGVLASVAFASGVALAIFA